MHDICNVVTNDFFPENLCPKSPKIFYHARWLRRLTDFCKFILLHRMKSIKLQTINEFIIKSSLRGISLSDIGGNTDLITCDK